MATIDIGKISFVNKGTWSNSTAYTERDVVQYTDNGVLSSYVAVASSTNQAPSTSGTANSNFWAFLAKGGADGAAGASGDSFNLSNNQIPFKNNSGSLTGLSIGSANQVLRVNSSANGYEFATPSSGAEIVKIGEASVSNASSGATYDIDIDPSYSGTTYYQYMIVGHMDLHNSDVVRVRLRENGGSTLAGSSYDHATNFATVNRVSGGISDGGNGQANDTSWKLQGWATGLNQGRATTNFVLYHLPFGYGSGWSNNSYKHLWGMTSVWADGNYQPTMMAFNGTYDGNANQMQGMRFFTNTNSTKNAEIKYYGFKK